jgi:sporulation protein YlmC with PRC-barrel domain
MFSEDGFVEMKDVETVGDDVVVVSGRSAVRRITDSSKPAGSSLKDLQGSWVTTLGGEHLGVLVDVEVTPATWTITDLILSDRRKLSIQPAEVTIGKDEILVPGNGVENLQAAGEEEGFLSRVFGRESMASLSASVTRVVKTVRERMKK